LRSPKDSRHNQVGLDRLVRLEWIEKTASLVLAGNDSAATKTILAEEIKDSFRSSDPSVRGSVDKTITILLKVWLNVPHELGPLRNAGLELLKRMHRTVHMPIHWGMIMAVYPFWASVAAQVGRLLKLQDSAAATHVQRRVREQYGERETVARRARYVLRSYVNWGVLRETNAKGIYTAGTTLAIDDSRLITWLTEASLHARSNGSVPLKDLIDSPSFFPFRIKSIHAGSLIAESSRLDIFRHGLDDDLVMLREPTPKGKEDRR